MAKSNDPHELDFANFTHLCGVLTLWGGVTYAVSAFFPLSVSALVAMLLVYCFSAAVRQAATPAIGWKQRLFFGGIAWSMFAVTMGLTSAGIYERVTAHHSALKYLESQQVPLERQLQGVISTARTANNAFLSWSDHSQKMARQEEYDGGGSCPGKLGSGGKNGPITAFRKNESVIATQLSGDIAATVKQLDNQISGAVGQRAKNFSDVKAITAKLNSAVETAQALTHGSSIVAAKDALGRAAESTITWIDGKKLACGDNARDEAILRANAALKSLAAIPDIKPIQIALDLDNRQALATHGLQRSGNLALSVATLGRAGSFNADPLLLAAYKENGAFNRESLSMWLGSLLELSVVITGILAARRAPLKLSGGLSESVAKWNERIAANPKEHSLLQRFGANVAGQAASLFYSSRRDVKPFLVAEEVVDETVDDRKKAVFSRPNHAGVDLVEDPELNPRDLIELRHIAPYMVTLGDCKAYVVIPPPVLAPLPNVAADSMVHRACAKPVAIDVPRSVIARNPMLATIEQTLPEAKRIEFRVFEIAPEFAQKLRLIALQNAPE